MVTAPVRTHIHPCHVLVDVSVHLADGPAVALAMTVGPVAVPYQSRR